MTNVIITGATSFIGVHIINEYINNNYKIIAVVRPNSKNLNRLPKSNLIRVIEIDMEKIEDIVALLQNEKIDAFYHLAWDGVRAPYRDDLELQTKNYEYAVNSMKVAKQLGCGTFIGAGSQAEYGKCIGKIDENYEPKPITEYGKAKLKTCETLKVMAKENNIKFIWTRIFSLYGIHDYHGTLIMSALDKMKRDESIPLTKCIQNWDFIYIEDAARVMYLLAVTTCEEGVYNIASGESKKLKDFVIAMKDICNSKSDLKFGEVPYSNEGIISFEPIVDKLRRNLGWSCQVTFDEGIKKILRFLS